MNHFTSFKQTLKNSQNTAPSKRTVQNILDYSKTVQIKKTNNCRVFFFMNN